MLSLPSFDAAAQEAAEGSENRAQYAGDDDEKDRWFRQIGLRFPSVDLVGEQEESAEDHPREQTPLRSGASAVVVEAGSDPANKGDDREDQIDAVGDAQEQPRDGAEDRRDDRSQGDLDCG